MTTTTDANAQAGPRTASGLVRAFQVLAALAVVNVLVQFITVAPVLVFSVGGCALAGRLAGGH